MLKWSTLIGLEMVMVLGIANRISLFQQCKIVCDFGSWDRPIDFTAKILCYTFFKHFDWLKMFRIQSECFKKIVVKNLRCKIFIGSVPGLLKVSPYVVVFSAETSEQENGGQCLHHQLWNRIEWIEAEIWNLVMSSVTRSLDWVFNFGHLQQRNFAKSHNYLPRWAQNCGQNKTSPV